MTIPSAVRRRAMWLLAALSLAPVAFYGYLGHFSRLMLDDYGLFASPLHMGFMHNFLHWRNSWFPSYSFYVTQDLLTPLDPARLPALMPTAILIAWLAGLTWLISLSLRYLGFTRDHLPVAITLAALTVFASVRSFHALESFYWFTSALRHTLPVGFMLLFVAAWLEFGGCRARLCALAALLGGWAFGFWNGGFSELTVAIQVVFLPILAVGLRRCVPGRFDRCGQVAFLAAFGGSLVSMVAQLTAPGLYNRMEASYEIPFQHPIRDPFALALETARSSIELIGNPASVFGFAFLLAAGLLAALTLYRPKTTEWTRPTFSLKPAPLVFGLCLQLAFAPAFWMPTGDPADCAGGSCQALDLLRAAHVVLLAAHALLLWRRLAVEAALGPWLAGGSRRAGPAVLAVLFLLALAQIPGLPAWGGAYLHLSALGLLLALANALASLAPDARSRHFGAFALAALALAGIALALTVAIGHFGLGYVFLRSLSFSVLLRVSAGLIWGAYIGFLIQRAFPTMRMTARDLKLGLLIVGGIVIAVMTDEAQQIPGFAAHAREWDARHAWIIEARDKGERDIIVQPYSFDMTAYIMASGKEVSISLPYYYGVDSIAESEDAASPPRPET